MQIERWDNSLAIRLPAELVRELNLKEGDQIDLVKEEGVLIVRLLPYADDVLEGLRSFQGALPASERLSRDEANER